MTAMLYRFRCPLCHTPIMPFRQVVQLHGSARDQSEASPNNFFDLISLGAVNKVAATGDGRCEQSSFVISTRIEVPNMRRLSCR